MVNLEGLSADGRHPSYEELSQLSLDAAIELDRRQRGVPVDEGIIESLIENLGLRTNCIGTGEALRSMVDPRTVDVYSRAVNHLTQSNIGTLDDLANKIRVYLDAFSQDLNTANPESITAMRDFCLAIHRELLTETYDQHNEMPVETN